jgi:hypothetical protein
MLLVYDYESEVAHWQEYRRPYSHYQLVTFGFWRAEAMPHFGAFLVGNFAVVYSGVVAEYFLQAADYL